MRSVDAYLSRRLQAVWPGAIVTCSVSADGVRHDFRAEFKRRESVLLGDSFRRAQETVVLIRKREKAAKAQAVRDAGGSRGR